METLAWNALQQHMHGSGPATLSMGGSKNVRIGYLPDSQKLFLRLPVDADTVAPPPRYAELDAAVVRDETGLMLEVSTQTSGLHQEFHRFAGLLAEEFENSIHGAIAAFDATMSRWLALATRNQVLSREAQLGLLGELLFLKALVDVRGPDAVSAWVGRHPAKPERHDFRLDNVEIEIKATRQQTRTHIIHGTRQLEPTPGHLLYVLSLQCEAAGVGSGRTLPDVIVAVRAALGAASEARRLFDECLGSTGYSDVHSEQYSDPIMLGTPPTIVPVDELCPRLTSAMITSALGDRTANRVSDLTYSVNLDGLGHGQGSDEYDGICNGVQLEVG